jgi:hypothetical protein
MKIKEVEEQTLFNDFICQFNELKFFKVLKPKLMHIFMVLLIFQFNFLKKQKL